MSPVKALTATFHKKTDVQWKVVQCQLLMTVIALAYFIGQHALFWASFSV